MKLQAYNLGIKNADQEIVKVLKTVRVYDAAAPEEIVTHLYANGILVNEINTDKIGLEEYYIDLMKEGR